MMKPAVSGGLQAPNGAGDGTRTRDPDLGKVVLYQLSYSRKPAQFNRSSGTVKEEIYAPAEGAGTGDQPR